MVSQWHNDRRRYNTGKRNFFIWNETIDICSNTYFTAFLKLHWPHFCQPAKLSYRFWYSPVTAPELSSSSYIIVIRHGKIVWKHGPHCWCFRLNLKYPGLLCRAYIKTAKNGDFCEELFSENDIEVVLTTFYFFDHGAKASAAVQKIATDHKEYRKCSWCVIICWIAKIHLAISRYQSVK